MILICTIFRCSKPETLIDDNNGVLLFNVVNFETFIYCREKDEKIKKNIRQSYNNFSAV
jgi:hypothetical protein